MKPSLGGARNLRRHLAGGDLGTGSFSNGARGSGSLSASWFDVHVTFVQRI